ncbi:MAG TPA: hypothetical protein ENJ32_04475 [Crenotrichaceae bacterium]|nr:hypothetical protein [Crenotrichaceae bacterium]
MLEGESLRYLMRHSGKKYTDFNSFAVDVFFSQAASVTKGLKYLVETGELFFYLTMDSLVLR